MCSSGLSVGWVLWRQEGSQARVLFVGLGCSLQHLEGYAPQAPHSLQGLAIGPYRTLVLLFGGSYRILRPERILNLHGCGTLYRPTYWALEDAESTFIWDLLQNS